MFTEDRPLLCAAVRKVYSVLGTEKFALLLPEEAKLNWDALIGWADNQLYKAKSGGRNRFEVMLPE